MESPYYKKYLKYYTKYLELKNKLSLVGDGQIGGAHCRGCKKAHSGKCKYQLDDSQIDRNYIMKLERMLRDERMLDIYKTNEEYFLEIICNLDKIIEIHYNNKNPTFWEYFTYFSQYIKDDIEYYNTFVAFYLEKTGQLNSLYFNFKDGRKLCFISEEIYFHHFLKVAMKQSIDEIIIPEDLTDIEKERMLRYFKKRVVNMSALYSLRKDDLTDAQLREFNFIMNEYKLYNIRSFSLEGNEGDDLKITDLVLMIIKLPIEQKSTILRILSDYKNITIYIAYYIVINKISLEEIEIIDKLIDTNYFYHTFYFIKVNYLNKKTYKWTKAVLYDFSIFNNNYKSLKNQIEELNKSLKEHDREAMKEFEDEEENPNVDTSKLLSPEEYTRRVDLVAEYDSSSYQIENIINNLLFKIPAQLSAEDSAYKSQLLEKPSLKPSPI
jgi:hypothetical protein